MFHLSTPLTTIALPLGNYTDNKKVKVEGKQFFYPFPPFGLIAKCLQKIQMDYAENFMIAQWEQMIHYIHYLSLEDMVVKKTSMTFIISGLMNQSLCLNSLLKCLYM